PMKTRTQHYAKEVFERVTEFKRCCIETNGKTAKTSLSEHGSMAHRMPVLIRTAGLAQALAFVDASASKKRAPRARGHPHRQLLEDLSQTSAAGSADDLLQASRKPGIDDYMRLSRESLAALSWFKRFAQSVLDVEPGDDHQADS